MLSCKAVSRENAVGIFGVLLAEAALFNGICWDGQQVVRAEDLEEASETGILSVEDVGTGDKKWLERYWDVKMRMADGRVLRILAVEEQGQVNYAMPFRNMEYDTIDYGKQIDEIRKRNEKSGDYATGAERMCGLKKCSFCKLHSPKCLWQFPLDAALHDSNFLSHEKTTSWSRYTRCASTMGKNLGTGQGACVT